MPPGFAFKGTSARERTGKESIGLGLYELEPGNQLWPYHFHVGNEEWAIVVSGTPTLRTPERERELRPGDVVGFPQGEEARTRSTTAAPSRRASRSSRRCEVGT